MDAKSFSTFSAVALAGLGDLPDTVMQRAVVLRMRRRAPGEIIEPFRRRQHAPGLDDLRDRVSAWATFHMRLIRDRWPEMPEGVTDRPADVWEPLLAIADQAGGHWPETARTACVQLLKDAQTADSGSLGVRLLSDLRAVWRDAGEPDGMHTETMLEALLALDEAPWSDLRGKPLDSRGLARRLRQYNIGSRSVRVGDQARKGYRREDLHDAWTRYLPPAPAEGSQGSQRSPQAENPVTPDERVTPTKVTTPPRRLSLAQLPGRCPTCEHHVETQGHGADCSEVA